MNQPIMFEDYLVFPFFDKRLIGKVIDFKWNDSDWEYFIQCRYLNNSTFWIPGNVATYL